MPKITVVGSANVDLVARVSQLPIPGETKIGTAFMQNMGGKGANQAVAAANLGAEVTFIARVGDDAYAEACMAAYRAAGVHLHAIQQTDDTSTGLALIGVAADGENSIIVVPGANGQLSPDDVQKFRADIESADVLLVQLEIPNATVVAAIEVAAAAGVLVILNPAPYSELPANVFPKVDIITPNLTESEHMLRQVLAEPKMMAKTLLKTGAKNAVVTMSARGAMAAGAWGEAYIPAVEITPVDTTGAGDAFNAGLAVAVAEGKSIPEAAKFASAVAAISCTREGAQPSLPTRNEVEKFMQARGL